jgi:hypothetical protein
MAPVLPGFYDPAMDTRATAQSPAERPTLPLADRRFADLQPADLQPTDRRELDERLSQRFIALDPAGYFLIRLDTDRGELVAELYANGVNASGLATDPDTGEVLSCRGGDPRRPLAIYRGRTAKELGIRLTEQGDPQLLSRLDHALYLGRELQKAEHSLFRDLPYVQD